jgi:hypothetical protein
MSLAEMEAGPPKHLLTASRQMITRPVQYELDSKADYQSFIAWYRNDISRGADWFDWTDPVDDTVKQARIVEGKVEATPLDKALINWVVSFDLETWE